jgi:hypothetical protein
MFVFLDIYSYIAMASTSNIEILERFQSKALRMIVDAPLLCAEYCYLKGSPNTNS